MKKVLLVAAMLIIAAPVLATVSVTATDKGSGVVDIRYNCSASEKVRAFALDIKVDNNLSINNIRDFNAGESKKPGGGYGIFPGRFADYINATAPNWSDPNYNPIAPTADPNARTGLGTGAITVELGTLYVDPNSPGTSGLLFRLDVNGNGSADGNLTIVLNGTRGGIVLEDANLAPSPVLTGTKVTFPPPCTNIPSIVGLATAAANSAITGAGLTVGTTTGAYSCTMAADLVISQDTGCVASGTAVNYTYSLGTTPMPNVVGLTRSAAAAAITAAGYTVGTDINVSGDGTVAVGSVYAQNPTAGATPSCGTAVTLSVVSYPIKDTSSFYANWVTNGKPSCWAYPRQCRGDADGKKQGLYWVGSNDLSILKTGYNKAVTAMGAGATCADFDHKKQGLYWVATNDLTIMNSYINKAESLVPLCGNTSVTTDVNYWYFCIPSGTCPSGQVCAPAGVCPNTP